jgi:hypothetical protein
LALTKPASAFTTLAVAHREIAAVEVEVDDEEGEATTLGEGHLLWIDMLADLPQAPSEPHRVPDVTTSRSAPYASVVGRIIGSDVREKTSGKAAPMD